jgi:hypothetical protein
MFALVIQTTAFAADSNLSPKKLTTQAVPSNPAPQRPSPDSDYEAKARAMIKKNYQQTPLSEDNEGHKVQHPLTCPVLKDGCVYLVCVENEAIDGECRLLDPQKDKSPSSCTND